MSVLFTVMYPECIIVIYDRQSVKVLVKGFKQR